MISAAAFFATARSKEYFFYSGVPCSYLSPLINFAIRDSAVSYIAATNEGDAVALAAGAWLGGRKGIVMMQNSGLGNAVNPLTSLNAIFHIPQLLIVTLRGGHEDEPQHSLMGAITSRLLELMNIPHENFPTDNFRIGKVLEIAENHFHTSSTPFALLLPKGCVESVESESVPVTNSSQEYRFSTSRVLRQARREQVKVDCEANSGSLRPRETQGGTSSRVLTRTLVLRALIDNTSLRDIIFATTGFSGRALYSLSDRPNHFYMVGSMGCVVSLALGLALVRPDLRVVAIDGDGAALMRLGALAVVGYEAPPNFIHILLDNGIHSSTGGQETQSATTDFAAVAAACGYADIRRVNDSQELVRILREDNSGPLFIHAKVSSEESLRLLRPHISPPDVAMRLREHIRSLGESV